MVHADSYPPTKASLYMTPYMTLSRGSDLRERKEETMGIGTGVIETNVVVGMGIMGSKKAMNTNPFQYFLDNEHFSVDE